MPNSKKPPRIIVREEQETTTANVTVPVEMPVVVGPCYYQLRAQDSSGNTNTQAVSEVPAFAISSSGPFTGLGGKTITFRYKMKAPESVTFASDVSDPSAASVASQFNTQSSGDVLARAVTFDDDSEVVVFYTSQRGEDEYFIFWPQTNPSDDGLSVLGLSPKEVHRGADNYDQTRQYIPQALFPDPDDLIEDLDIIEDDIRAFIYRGPSDLYECQRERAFVRGHHYVQVQGDVDLSTLSYPDAVMDKTFSMTVYPDTTEKSVVFGQSLRRAIIDTVNEMVTDYMNHKANANGSYHTSADTSNSVATTPLSYDASLSSIISVVSAFITAYNGHDNEGGSVHSSTGGYQVTGHSSLTTWADVLDALTDGTAGIVAQYNAHVQDGTIHSSADSTNILTNGVADSGWTNPTWPQEIATEINAVWPDVATISVNNLLLTFNDGKAVFGTDDGVTAVLGSSWSGATAATIHAYDDGDGDSTTPWLLMPPETYLMIPPTTAQADVTLQSGGSNLTYPDDVEGKFLRLSVDGLPMIRVDLDNLITDPDALAQRVNDALGGNYATYTTGISGEDILRITTVYTGVDAVIKFDLTSGGSTNLLNNLDSAGLPDEVTRAQTYHQLSAGDELWYQGQKRATLVADPVVVTDGYLVMTDTEFPIDFSSDHVYFYTNSADFSGDTPLPEMWLDARGSLHVKHEILRDNRGDPMTNVSSPLVVSYKGLRLDVTAAADTPSLLVFDSTSEIESALGEIDPDNPLAFAVAKLKEGGPNIRVAALGVSEVSDAQPEGTASAYREAFEFLKGWDVYWVIPLSQSYDVHVLAASHVAACNDPEVGRFRRTLLSVPLPTRQAPTVVASGSDGESPNTNTFNTHISGLSILLSNAGVDPTGGLTVDDGVYLQLEDDDSHYLITAVNGTQVTISTSFASNENTDGFFSTEDLESGLVQQNFSIIIRGAEISTKDDQAAALNAYGQLFQDSHVQVVFPDLVEMVVDGTPTLVEGYHAASYFVGIATSTPPSEPLSGTPLSGIYSARRAFPYFSQEQLNIIAGGGVMIFASESADGTNVKVRHQLTTDLTSAETSELSCIRAVDYTAKMLKLSLEPLKGRLRTKDGIRDAAVVINGVKALLIKNGVNDGMEVEIAPRVSDTDETTIEARLSVSVPKPGNVYDVTLVF